MLAASRIARSDQAISCRARSGFRDPEAPPKAGANEADVVRLDGAATTLLLRRGDGLPEIAYWGARLPDRSDGEAWRGWLGDVGAGPALLPTIGNGYPGQPGLAAHRLDRDWTAGFSVTSLRTVDAGLIVTAQDAVADLALTLRLTLSCDDVLVMSSTLRNLGQAPLEVDHLAAGVFLLPAAAGSVLLFGGGWGREMQERRTTLQTGCLAVETRGNRAQRHFPGLIAGAPGFSEDTGLVFGAQLAWSGNHRISAERLDDGRILLMLGELLYPGEVVLAPGEQLDSPAACATLSADGLAGLSRRFQSHVRGHVLHWPGGAMRPRPVTFNTWETDGFALDPARLAQQVDAAAKLGVERFVLDDGWFRGRRSDRAGLGDWTPDPQLFPDGLGPLAHQVLARGMEFGLWVEPEMVNPDSDLYRARPDAVLQVAGRPLLTSRNQLVLDLTRPDIAGRIFAALDRLLRDLPIAYLKWDMNRDLTAAGDAEGRPAYRRQVLAVYALIDRVRAAHPALEIESCASGGGRADLGMLERTQRIWPSDDTDPLQRLAIQRGFSRFLPPEVLATHIPPSPSHETGRSSSLSFRAAVAMFGHLGIDVDPLALSADAAAELAQWIALHKRLRPLLHAGLHQAVPDAAGQRLHGVVAPDRRHAVFLLVQERLPPWDAPVAQAWPGLDPALTYRVRLPPPQRLPGWQPTAAQRRLAEDGVPASGALLLQAGLPLPSLWPETALLLELQAEPAPG